MRPIIDSDCVGRSHVVGGRALVVELDMGKLHCPMGEAKELLDKFVAKAKRQLDIFYDEDFWFYQI